MAATLRGDRERVLRRAEILQRRANDAVRAYAFARARDSLRTAIRMLDTVDASGDQALTSVWVRVLVSHAYVNAEGSAIAPGLRDLDRADATLAELPHGPVRAELHGLVLQQRGFLLLRAGRTEEGMEVLDIAVEQLESGLRQGVGDPDVLAGLYLNRSMGFIGRGRTKAALTALDRCMEICRQHDLPQISAKVRHNLGYVAYMTGDMPAALRNYAEAERGYQEFGASLIPLLRLDLSRALLAAGLADDAARHLEEAVTGLRRQRAGQDSAEAEVTLAAATLLGGRFADARKLARSAERRFGKLGNVRWAAIAALAGLRADTTRALRSGRVPIALPVAAVKLAEELRSLMLEDEAALALLLAVRLELYRGEVVSAEMLLERIPRPRVTTPVDHQMLLRLCRAELAVAQGNARKALTVARSGMTFLGSARDRMGGLELVCGTAIHGQELGEFAIRLVLGRDRPNPRSLFDWLERTRAQVYRYEPLPTFDDPDHADRAAELRRLRRAVQLDRLAGRPVQRQARQAAAVQREVARQGYASQWGRPRPVVRAPEVMDALGDRALVSFASSGGRLVAVVLTKERASLVRLGDFAAAAEWAARLHADLDALAPDTLPAPIVDVVRQSATRSAEALDDQLIRPLRTLIGDRQVVVVPTGTLYAVHWGCLPSLIGTPIMVAPSATAWLAAETAHRVPTGRTVLARGPMLTGLVAEETELRTVYPNAVAFDEDSAGVRDVLAAMDGADLVHLAAHGEHEPTNALFSRLELADGPLFAYEMARLRQPPRQVVLAACELALTYVRPGDEALGYAGALLATGVRTVVAAVSRVGDESAATAMVDYHRALAAGVAPAEALSAAVAVDPYRRPFTCLGAG